MKKLILPFVILLISVTLSAQLPELTISSADQLPVTLDDSNDNAYVDLNGNGQGDMYFSFYSEVWSTLSFNGATFVSTGYDSWAFNYYQTGVNIAEFLINSSGEVIVFPYGQTFGTDFFSSFSSGYFSESGYLATYDEFTGFPPVSPLTDVGGSYSSGLIEVNNGYLAVKYWNTASTSFYGWIGINYNSNIASPSVTLQGAYFSPQTGAPVYAGIGGPAVPIPFIASIFTMLLIGGAAFLRKRRK